MKSTGPSSQASGQADPAKGKLNRQYDSAFQVTPEYLERLPDVQNGTSSQVLGSNVPILEVGISNFRLPLSYLTQQREKRVIDTTVNGSVSLSSEKKGINMSRIMRVFYEFKDRVMDFEVLEEILLRYKEDIDSSRARLKLTFDYPMLQQSLRSEQLGYQYYRVSLEGEMDDLQRCRKLIHFDFVYSSACPCSADLAEHAREERQVYTIPHSQRSKARISAEIAPGAHLYLEEMQQHCLHALQTETQVMVKREDEQAFAELNGAYVKFVEDAARLLHEQFDNEPRIRDFQVACAHLESLHSHDAVAVINKGIPGGFSSKFEDFRQLIC